VRVHVDLERCEAHGECTIAAPEVFDLDDHDLLHYDPEPDESLRPKVERAVRVCPVQAISIPE
jgi:ferredoxin